MVVRSTQYRVLGIVLRLTTRLFSFQASCGSRCQAIINHHRQPLHLHLVPVSRIHLDLEVSNPPATLPSYLGPQFPLDHLFLSCFRYQHMPFAFHFFPLRTSTTSLSLHMLTLDFFRSIQSFALPASTLHLSLLRPTMSLSSAHL